MRSHELTRTTRPQRLTATAPVGSLFKRPLARMRQPRRRYEASDPLYLTQIRQLPCLCCGLEPCGEAAHVRLQSAAHGKRGGMAKKPADAWAAPLCGACHRESADALHRIGELTFWHRLGLQPLLICTTLHAARGDVPRMRAIVFHFIAERQKWPMPKS
jgi:hypothetical protein